MVVYVSTLVIVSVSIGALLAGTLPYVLADDVPTHAYARNYALHPVPAVAHIVPGLIFVIGAGFQTWPGFRRKHLTLHRRMGRVVAVAGLTAASAGLYVGISHPYDGWSERSASMVFGSWMLLCLVVGWRAVRRRDVATHRRWMIRAFAVALAISTIRLWAVIFSMTISPQTATGLGQLAPPQSTFGLAFWLGFGLNVAAAEWWLRRPRTTLGR